MKRADDHPLSLSQTGSFGGAAQAEGLGSRTTRNKLLARLARLWPLVAIVLLALGPIVGWFAYGAAESVRKQRLQVRFAEALANRAHRMSGQTLSYTEVLYACQGLFDASETVTQNEFSTFTRQARSRHPGIEAIAWAPRGEVDGGQVDGGQVDGGQVDGAESYALRFVEPLEPNRHLLGRDLLEDEAHRVSLRRGLLTRKPALSKPIASVVGGKRTSALGELTLGVYAASRDGQRGEPIGVVMVRFRFAPLLTAAADESAGKALPRMHIALRDITEGEPGRPLASSGSDLGADSQSGDASGIAAQQQLVVAGRRWRLDARPTAHFLAQHETSQSLGAALLVFLAWEFFAGLLLLFSAASRCHALRRQGRTVGRVLQSLGEGVIVAGADGHVRLSNEASRGLVGTVVDDVDAATFARAVRFVDAKAKKAYGPCEAPLERAMRGEVFDEERCFVYTPNCPHGVPVSVSGRPLRDEWGKLLGGVLALRDDTERRKSELVLHEQDLKLRERRMEMELAAQVQKRLYPRTAPKLIGLELAGAVQPADETCGDYYDFLELGDGSLCLAIGDVSGHGLGPALVMAETRAYIRSLARAGEPPRAILERCNAQLSRDLADDLFVTMLLIRIEKGGRSLSYASAGHTPALLISKDGVLKAELGRTGLPLGMFEESTYQAESGIDFDVGDVLVLMTDGVTEASCSSDGEHFEETGVYNVVRRHRHRTAGEILKRIDQALTDYAGEARRRDDVTLVVCKRTAAFPARLLSETWSGHGEGRRLGDSRGSRPPRA